MKTNWLKYSLQFTVLGLIILFFFKPFFGLEPADVEAYCPFGGLQALMAYLEQGTLACSMTFLQIIIGMALALMIILFGKLFCGYLCPLGTITEYLGRLRKPLHINWEIKTGSVADKLLRSIKYILLAWIFYMTIGASELFCKKFDPYYAMATGFQGEIVLWMSIISIGIFVLGSIFIKMFWCKYICPLGALSNVFRFTWTFLAVLAVFILLNLLGFTLSWQYLLIVAVLIAYIWEIIYYRTQSKYLPLLKITRDKNTCNNCGICSKRCPMSIDVDKEDEVKDVDCTLCGDCITACPKKSLQINKKPSYRWLPGILIVVFFILALIIGSQWQIPTIDERWGDYQNKELEKVEMEGIKSVKCFGSSKAFSAKMKTVEGIYGATTYTKTHRVIVYFDPSEISKEKVQEVIFEPTKLWINDIPENIEQVKIMTLGVEGLFDVNDVDNLSILLSDNPDFYALQSEYACPVIIKLFMNPDYEISKKELAKLVEVRVYEIPFEDGIFELECNYELVSIDKQLEYISRQEFLNIMFNSQSAVFQKNIDKYGLDFVTYYLPYPELENSEYQNHMLYLSSYLSGFEGIVGWQTGLIDEEPTIQINYIPSVMTETKLWEILTMPIWTIYWSEDESEDIEALMHFDQPGKTMEKK